MDIVESFYVTLIAFTFERLTNTGLFFRIYSYHLEKCVMHKVEIWEKNMLHLKVEKKTGYIFLQNSLSICICLIQNKREPFFLRLLSFSTTFILLMQY
jgi:hypothetical protein